MGIGAWLIAGTCSDGFAQDANMDRAKHVYELFVADQGTVFMLS